MPPEDDMEWEDYFYEPPEPAFLKESFNRYQHAFEVNGNGHRFMQDLELQEGEVKEISALLIEAPGGKTLRDNLDHFIKRGTVQRLCPPCAVTALFTLQTNAPSGGVGHRTSLRGGGPLTTLVLCDPRGENDELADSLWRNLWLNVLNSKTFLRLSGNPSKNQDADTFPWLAPTRTSENKTGKATTPEDAHPAQMFWSMPRRIRLDFSHCTEGVCDICGTTSERLLSHYQTKNYGINYEGPWRHPLSPHNIDKQGFPLPVHPQPGGVVYRHWLGLVQRNEDSRREPAWVVREFQNKRLNGQFRIWAFGYDMDNMKARCWYESTMPLYQLDTEIRPEFENIVASLIKAATEIASNLRSALKRAWFKRSEDVKGDTSFIDNEFWQGSESKFYAALTSLKESLEQGNNPMAIRRDWHTTLCRHALLLFDRWAVNGPIEDADPKRIAKARHELGKFNRGRKITELLGLPKPEKRQAESVVAL
jgi:CRISPR system Cascade subunit CasA